MPYTSRPSRLFTSPLLQESKSGDLEILLACHEKKQDMEMPGYGKHGKP
jgi:hypothetical protein